MRVFAIIAALSLSACATPSQDPKTANDTPDHVTPYKVAAGNDQLAQRATPSRARVADIYHWVHTRDYPEIEARLRDDIPGNTQRLYNPKDGVRVKYVGDTDVFYWSAGTKVLRRGTWDIQEGKFGPQICETFYGQTDCLNTVEQLSGVGLIDRRQGDVFGLSRGGRPQLGEDGLPQW